MASDLDYGSLPDGRDIKDADIQVSYTFRFKTKDGEDGSVKGSINASRLSITGTMKAEGSTADAFPVPEITLSGKQAKQMANMLKRFLDVVIQKGQDYAIAH